MTSAARRALALLVEPAHDAATAAGNRQAPRIDVAVTGLSAGCGTTTLAAGLRRELPDARVLDGIAPGSVDVLVVVAGRAALPVLARLVTDRLRARHSGVMLVANRPEDPAEWERAGALCVPQSRLGVLLLAHGRRAPGAFAAALRRVAAGVAEEAARHGS